MTAIRIRITLWLRKTQRRWLLYRVQKALGIKLYDWQYNCLLTGEEPPAWVYSTRRSGSTMFNILDLLLTDGGTIILSPYKEAIWDEPFISCGAYNSFVWMREDSVTIKRQEFFILEMLEVKDKLAMNRIKTRKVMLSGWGPYQPNGEW